MTTGRINQVTIEKTQTVIRAANIECKRAQTPEIVKIVLFKILNRQETARQPTTLPVR